MSRSRAFASSAKHVFAYPEPRRCGAQRAVSTLLDAPPTRPLHRLVALLGLPLLNYFAPAFMATRVAGFTLSWLILGVLFFPFVWIISYIFIKRSLRLEEAEVQQLRR